LRFNSTDSSFEGYDGSAWGAIGGGAENSFTVFEYTATASQTTFSGADDNAATLSYTAGNIQVILNGVVLDPSDYTATNGTSVVLASGAALNDVLNIYAFTSFTVADTVSASTGGTFSANVTVTGDLTVDTNTLYVDSTNNRVGIGTSLPLGPLHISSDGSETDFRSVSTKAGIALNYNGGGISYYDSDTTIFRKSTSGSSTELMRILPSGGITFNGDTAAANALDDYEEGTWTPTPISLTTSGTVTYTGTYTKIGRFVFGLLTVVSSGGTTTATADTTRFSGLPFTSDSIGGMGLSVITGTTSGTAAGQVGGAGTTLITGGWSATSSIRMSFWYTTT
jgi:hypothetical protein